MAFVANGGVVSSLFQPPATWATGSSAGFMQLADDYTADYATIWRTQSSVRTVTSFLARNIASLGLHTFERVSDVDRRRLTDHPLAVLLGKPNPRTTYYRLMDALVHDLCIYDRAYWWKARFDSSRPGLVRLPPWLVTPKGGSVLGPDYFTVEGSKGRRDVPVDQVVHFRGYNPADDRDGCSPMEGLRQLLAEEWEAGRWRRQVLRNGGRFSGYLKRPAGQQWSPEARARFKASWQSQYAGGGAQAGGTPVLEDGMEFVPAAQTAEQAQYVEARKLTREEAAAAYFVPPPMVGLLDHATFSNITEQHKMLYQDTLGPWLEQITQEIELQLLPDLDTSSASVYVEFNLEAKLRGSFEDQAVQLRNSVGAPFMTRNEARGRLNLPQIDGGDELVTPLNVLVGDTPADPTATTSTTAGGSQ